MRVRQTRNGRYFALLLFTACKCGHLPVSPEEKVLQLVPADSQAAVILPQAGSALERVGQLGEALAKIPGGDVIRLAVGDLVAQLGADPRTAAGLTELGIDGKGAAAIWLPALVSTSGSPSSSGAQGSEGEWVRNSVLALPVADAARAQKRLFEIARRAGAVGEPERLNDVSQLRDRKGAVVLATTTRQGFLLISFAGSAALKAPVAELGSDRTLRGLRPRVGTCDALVWVPAGSRIPAASLLGVRADGRGVHARLASQLDGFAGLAPTGAGAAFAPVSADAVVNIRLAGAPSVWGQLLRRRSSALQMIAAAAIDPDQELFGNLAAGLQAEISLSRAPDFTGLPGFDPRRFNPFRWVRMTAQGEVRDAALARATLEKLARTGPTIGVTWGWHDLQGVRVLTAHDPFGENVSIALQDKRVFVTGGEGEMARALAGAKPRAPETGPLLRVRFSPSQLVSQIQEIPAGAYGGLSGLTARALMWRIPILLAHFGEQTLDLDLDERVAVLTADLDVPLQ